MLYYIVLHNHKSVCFCVLLTRSSAVAFGWKWFQHWIKWYLIGSRRHSYSATVRSRALCFSVAVVSFPQCSHASYQKKISNWHFKDPWPLTQQSDVMISGDVMKRKRAAGVKCSSVLSFKWLFHLRDLVIRSFAEPHTVLHRLSLPHSRAN